MVEATENDLARVLEIEREAISPPWTPGGLLREIYNDNSFFVLASEDDAVLGFVILRRIGSDGELFQIAVDAANRRCGVADALMEAALRQADGFDVNSLYLEVRKSNAAAIALYEKHGFRQTGSRKDYYTEPVEDAATMERRAKD